MGEGGSNFKAHKKTKSFQDIFSNFGVTDCIFINKIFSKSNSHHSVFVVTRLQPDSCWVSKPGIPLWTVSRTDGDCIAAELWFGEDRWVAPSHQLQCGPTQRNKTASPRAPHPASTASSHCLWDAQYALVRRVCLGLSPVPAPGQLVLTLHAHPQACHDAVCDALADDSLVAGASRPFLNWS